MTVKKANTLKSKDTNKTIRDELICKAKKTQLIHTHCLSTICNIQLPAGLLASLTCKLNTFRKSVKNVVTSKGLN